MPAVSDMPAITLPPIELPRPDVAAFELPASLPRDAASLAALLHAQQKALVATVETLHAQATQAAQHILEQAVQRAAAQAVNEYVVRMVEQAKLARHRLYGASWEQMAALQQGLFDEAEALAQGSSEAQDEAPQPPADAGGKVPSRKARGKRTALPSGLLRVDVVHDVPESGRKCPCAGAMVVIGEDVSEQLDIVPMQVRVLRHVRKRYGCPGSAHAPLTAPLPPQPRWRSTEYSFNLKASHATHNSTTSCAGHRSAAHHDHGAQNGIGRRSVSTAAHAVWLLPRLDEIRRLLRKNGILARAPVRLLLGDARVRHPMAAHHRGRTG
ncbi:IS66 family transposase zinc-finger binding domain-containing protein [Massilia scottii]|uniref:IS66 family transposase zinc-finger binding domain-containing protein n=1 Tax=Massilia scottii TaxID=3057166 RepID=UPI002796A6C5|nr:IS66 family transposase zinc-finger binding domain-containing protein [Massilia sp. CCM 9029]MDQ1834728.1 IS66 family transposase zinc-finger binding domain-containing protein [Massilia sp. CCM 9029]